MKLLTKNKRAYFDYDIAEKLTAGIVLRGHEVKAIKTGHINLSDAIVHISEGEAWLVNMDIPLYKHADPRTVPGYEPKGRRKLLLSKRELTKLREKTHKSGLRVLPLALLYSASHKVKVEIGLGKRKKKIEKRSVIQDRQTKRMIDREMKARN